MNDFAMYHSGSPILYYASECRGLWVCTDELHFNDLVADRIKGVSPWWKRVMWEYKNYGVHKTIATHTLQAQTKTLLLLSSLESGILNPKSLINRMFEPLISTRSSSSCVVSDLRVRPIFSFAVK